jgi:hypothetical protein
MGGGAGLNWVGRAWSQFVRIGHESQRCSIRLSTRKHLRLWICQAYLAKLVTASVRDTVSGMKL